MHYKTAMAWRAVANCFSLGILFFCLGTTGVISATTKKPPPEPVNINTATSAELQQVPGIGPATADKILKMRKSYGAFKSVDDLLAIRGIGKKRLDKMRRYLSVGIRSSSKKAPAATKPAPDAQKPSP